MALCLPCSRIPELIMGEVVMPKKADASKGKQGLQTRAAKLSIFLLLVKATTDIELSPLIMPRPYVDK